MAELVFAAGVPHAPGLIGLLSAAPVDIQKVVHDMYAQLRAALLAARPDVLIIIGNDHLANSRTRSYPDFLIGMAAEHKGPFEWYKEWLGSENYQLKGNPAVAEQLFKGLNKRGYRMHGDRENLRFDDNVTIPAVHLDLENTDITIIPVLQNCTVPPLPDTQRCYEIGQAMADVIANDMAADLRVAVLGSGGLSHEPGGSRYWYIDKDFDLWFMELMASGDHASLLRDLTVARMEQSGSGGTLEVLSWVVTAGITGPRYGVQSDYALHSNFKCGIGAVLWDLSKTVDKPLSVRDPGPVTTEPTLLSTFDPSLSSHDLVQDLKWNSDLRAEFARNESGVLDRYPLKAVERKAIEERDFKTLYELGFHPYLGGQLARLIYGNAAGKEANFAVQKLVDSLKGEGIDSFAKDEGITTKS